MYVYTHMAIKADSDYLSSLNVISDIPPLLEHNIVYKSTKFSTDPAS